MPQAIKLSDLLGEIDATISNRFFGRTFWIKAEITDVKKQPDKRWCFLKFIEKERSAITTEIKGVFWSNTYFNIENFEANTSQTFASGLEITCCVRVRFHKRFGIDLEVLEIDYAYTIGKLELERKQTLDRLVQQKIALPLPNGNFATKNNQVELPMVLQKVALVTAPNSDGQRDFKEVVLKNNYGYAFQVTEYLTQIQGDTASSMIMQQLKAIENSNMRYDLVAIVRGGGSDTDFKAFNDFDLAQCIAQFPIPILTGIGHDRNTSIADLMARQYKTPTEVAKYIVENNYYFDSRVQELKEELHARVKNLLENARRELEMYKIRVKSTNPQTILNRGFAIVMNNGKIVMDTAGLTQGTELETIVKSGKILSTVTQTKNNEKGTRL